MNYWPVYLVLFLFTVWLCQVHLYNKAGVKCSGFVCEGRAMLLAKWFGALISGLFGLFISPVFWFIAVVLFAATGWQVQQSYWVPKSNA